MTDQNTAPTMGANAGKATSTEPATWEEIARHLWDLLDDIDTAGDMFKPALEPFEKYVLGKTRERFKHSSSDGYEVTFNARADLAPKVKPLEFSDEGYAYSGLGSMYHITFHNDLSKGWILFRWEAGEQTRIGRHEDYDELIKIADKDNRDRILSALTTAPVTPQQAAIDALEQAARMASEFAEVKLSATFPCNSNAAIRETCHEIAAGIRALKAIAEEGE